MDEIAETHSNYLSFTQRFLFSYLDMGRYSRSGTTHCREFDIDTYLSCMASAGTPFITDAFSERFASPGITMVCFSPARTRISEPQVYDICASEPINTIMSPA